MTRLVPCEFDLIPYQFRGFPELGNFDHKNLGGDDHAVEPIHTASGSFGAAIQSDQSACGRFDPDCIDEKFLQTFDVIAQVASPFEGDKHNGTGTDIQNFSHHSTTGELTNTPSHERRSDPLNWSNYKTASLNPTQAFNEAAMHSAGASVCNSNTELAVERGDGLSPLDLRRDRLPDRGARKHPASFPVRTPFKRNKFFQALIDVVALFGFFVFLGATAVAIAAVPFLLCCRF
jgi:hypothetical protein